MLTKYISANQRDWFKYINNLAYAYNSSPQKSKGYLPYFLLFGREARVPIDTGTTFYHAQSNGQLELFNATINNRMGCIVKYAVFAYNTSFHRTIGEMPFVLYKNFKPNLPIDQEIEPLGKSNSDYTRLLRDWVKATNKLVQARVKKSQDEQKARYDAKRKKYNLEILYGFKGKDFLLKS